MKTLLFFWNRQHCNHVKRKLLPNILEIIILSVLLLIISKDTAAQPQWSSYDPTDIAQFKPTKQSSVFEVAGSARAVDGNTDGNWGNRSVIHSNGSDQPWWEVNLLDVYDISSITIYNRTDCCPERLDNFSIRVSETPFRGNNGGQVYNTDTKWFSDIKTFTGSARGQYVRIHLNGNGILALAEVVIKGTPAKEKVIGPDDNLALGKNTRQSSVAYYSPSHLGNDGNTDGDWNQGSVFHTGGDRNAFWEVDLGKNFLVKNVVIYNRTDTAPDRLKDFNIWVTKQPKDEIYTQLTPFASEPAVIPGSHNSYSGAKIGRYVRVELNGTNYLHLAEVQVFGTEVGDLIVGKQESNTLYRASIYRNGATNKANISSEKATNITEGFDFSRTVEKSDKHYWELSVTASTSIKAVLADIDLEVSAKGGGEYTNTTSTSKSNNFSESRVETQKVDQEVPANCTRYEIQKFIVNEVPMTYTFNGETTTFYRVLDKSKPINDLAVMVFPNNVDPGLNESKDLWISEEDFNRVWTEYNNKE